MSVAQKIKTSLTVMGCLAGIVLCMNASAAPTADSMKKAVTNELGIEPDSVEKSVLPGLWEVIKNGRIFYVDDTLKYVVMGNIFDAKTQTNLTQESEKKFGAKNWKNWPFKDAIKQVYGKGERQIVVFSDANCGYCRDFERTLERVGNLTVYTFVTPLIRGEENNREVVCAKDPAKAWHDWMVKGTSLPAVQGNCNTEVLQRNLMLAAKLGLRGSPALFFPTGEKVNGAIPANALEEILSQQQK